MHDTLKKKELKDGQI